MNLTILTGNLTRDPEMRYTSNAKAVTNFSIAVNEGSGDKRTTEFFDCEAWEKLAELVAEHCTRGKKVLVTGRLRTESWNNKKYPEVKMKKMIVVCRNVEFLTPRDPAEAQPTAEPDLSDLSF